MLLFRRLALVPLAVVIGLLQACGGGGGESAPPAAPPAASPAGVYGNAEVSVIADGAGRLIGTAMRSSPSSSYLVHFSGTAAMLEDRSWKIQDARLFVDVFEANSSSYTYSTTATVVGSFVPGASLTFTLPSPPASQGFPGTWTVPFTNEGRITASLAAAVGHYTWVTGSPRNPLVQTDLEVDGTGRVTGRFYGDCSIDAALFVVDAAGIVLTGRGTLSGAGCPAGSAGVRTFLGTMGGSSQGQPGSMSITTTLDDGRPFTGQGFRQ